MTEGIHSFGHAELRELLRTLRAQATLAVERYATQHAPHVPATTVAAISQALGDISLDEAINTLDRIEREAEHADYVRVRQEEFIRTAAVDVVKLATLLRRYLDNHCRNADAEGMSVLCECLLCLDTREALKG